MSAVGAVLKLVKDISEDILGAVTREGDRDHTYTYMYIWEDKRESLGFKMNTRMLSFLYLETQSLGRCTCKLVKLKVEREDNCHWNLFWWMQQGH
jgi:hypothetical protein